MLVMVGAQPTDVQRRKSSVRVPGVTPRWGGGEHSDQPARGGYHSTRLAL